VQNNRSIINGSVYSETVFISVTPPPYKQAFSYCNWSAWLSLTFWLWFCSKVTIRILVLSISLALVFMCCLYRTRL